MTRVTCIVLLLDLSAPGSTHCSTFCGTSGTTSCIIWLGGGSAPTAVLAQCKANPTKPDQKTSNTHRGSLNATRVAFVVSHIGISRNICDTRPKLQPAGGKGDIVPLTAGPPVFSNA